MVHSLDGHAGFRRGGEDKVGGEGEYIQAGGTRQALFPPDSFSPTLAVSTLQSC